MTQLGSFHVSHFAKIELRRPVGACLTPFVLLWQFSHLRALIRIQGKRPSWESTNPWSSVKEAKVHVHAQNGDLVSQPASFVAR